MQNKWGKDGLVVATVNFNYTEQDTPKEKYVGKALELLKARKIDLPNFFLDEGDVVLEKLRIVAFPAIYVFDREGRWTAFKAVKGAADAEEKEIEQFVEKLVKEKAGK